MTGSEEKKWIGLTGGIGSGKSLVAQMLKEQGAAIIDADEISHALVTPKSPAWREIVQVFGEEILKEDLSLDRKKLGRIVFANPEKKEQLESILHPKVFSEEARQYQEAKRKNPDVLVFLVSPLLFETGNFQAMKSVVLVACDENTQLERVIMRDGLSREDVLKRMSRQMSVERKREMADYIIDNDSSIDELREKVITLYKNLTQ